MASVNLKELAKEFGSNRIVQGINLDIAHNEFIALLGPSGCGKSTTLRMIAGLESVSSGEVLVDGLVVNDLAPKDRDIAMVFQDYALYPHMSVYDNMSFGLSIQRVPKSEIHERVLAAAQALNIANLLDRKPKELSGGQRQRVAMGRAIVRRPKVFLFDEPLSNLDTKLRAQMRTEIKRLHQQVATTVIYVTHDQVEAMTLADRIVLLRGGLIEQVGTPDQIYNHPASMFVAGFIGSPSMNFVPGVLTQDASAVHLDCGPPVTLSLSTEQTLRYRAHGGRRVIVGIRPENILPASGRGEGGADLCPILDMIEPLGSDTLVFFQLGEAQVVARLPPSTRAARGTSMALQVDAQQLHLFDPGTEKAL
ncbi:ABC transporter ATP-binding protein [Variovorax sp. OV329]|uniref:ABC transporter ATP-binding protein n=1 Tax=Variovorax sp. OV329 TaxID=1882825 RepID=UPI0008E55668|nr:sn-glycerol-3-phosphate ABC transporter ATP-binding protein UgpC [Variovorax sp. OV329]SFN52313.1 carbohydrate ABC transporter ATP-binding protein, CUT1 family [Variovorax sp. OV329]